MSESSTAETTPRQAHLSVLDDAALRRWVFRARDALGRHRHRLDALNVYPVPDGDTGTNLYLTLDGGLDGFVDTLMERGRAGENVGITAGVNALARASLFAARGNSGVILSQLIAGLAGALSSHSGADEVGVDGPLFVEALQAADDRARRAVTEPVEGTILTVIRAAADAARDCVDAGDTQLVTVVSTAHEAARAALEATPTQLEALARAGVVDAGGAGLVVILDALASVVRGDPPELAAEAEASAGGVTAPAPLRSESFEVMYLIDGLTEEAGHALAAVLKSLGDSVIVAGDTQLRTVHVHTPDPGAAVEAALDAGRPYGIRITLLTDDCAQHAHPAEALSPDAGLPTQPGSDDAVDSDGVQAGDALDAEAALGVVACVQAPRLRGLFEDAGAAVVLDAPGRRVTPAEIVAAARSTGARQVVVLPDDSDAVMATEVARDLAAEDGLELLVIPTRHLLQGLAALAVFEASDEGSAQRMRSAADAVRVGWVATATSTAETDAGRCEPGDVLGVVEGRTQHLGQDACAVAVEVVRSLSGPDSELVTFVEGADAAGLGDRVAQALSGSEVEVEVLDGGQVVYDLMIGVE